MSSSIAPSLISKVGMWGRKSLPTKKHMNTAKTKFSLASKAMDTWLAQACNDLPTQETICHHKGKETEWQLNVCWSETRCAWQPRFGGHNVWLYQ